MGLKNSVMGIQNSAVLALTLTLILLLVPSSLASDRKDFDREIARQKSELETLRSRLQSEQKALESLQEKKENTLEHLDKLSGNIHHVEEYLGQLDATEETLDRSLVTVKQELDGVENRIKERNSVMAKRVKTLFMKGSPDRMILQGWKSGNEDFLRKVFFMKRVIRYDKTLVSASLEDLELKQKTAAKLDRRLDELSQFRAHKSKERETFTRAKREQEKNLAAIQSDEVAKRAALAEMEENAKLINDIIATLEKRRKEDFRLGLGVSGPQVSEGWHGVRFAKPLTRTREYVAIVKLALSRQRVKFAGEFFTLPLPDGPGKALALTVHPVREHIPIYLASIGPKNLELTGEIADGWLGIFFAPEYASEQLAAVSAGRAKVDKTLEGFEVIPTVPVVIGDDVEVCAASVRPYCALYVGGMGSREHNFYNALVGRMGFDTEAGVVQDKYLARDYEGAAAAVPFDFIDRIALIGPRDRIKARLSAYADAGVTTLAVAPHAATLAEKIATLRTMAEVLDESGLAT